MKLLLLLLVSGISFNRCDICKDIVGIIKDEMKEWVEKYKTGPRISYMIYDPQGAEWSMGTSMIKSFIINFIFAAIPTFLIAGAVAWKYSPYTEGGTIFIIASIAALVVGLAAGIWRSRFWDTASTIGSYTTYSKKKDQDNE